MTSFSLAKEDEGTTLAAALRRHLSISWSEARSLCETGKVFVNQRRELRSVQRVTLPASVEIRMNAKAPLPTQQEEALRSIVYEDSQLIVINKPSGISSVPFERGETGTAMDFIRDAWRAEGRSATSTPLLVVHRIDKDTSGLLMFAKTKPAELWLQHLFRNHDVERTYVCVVHGRVLDKTIETYFVSDRGDGLRGSVKDPSKYPQARRAITHVRAMEYLPEATVCEVRLETGKTHQIRIHLAEKGHPLVGETVYIRDFLRDDKTPIQSERLLLHAKTLGFVHPTTQEPMSFSSELPMSFSRVLRKLRKAVTK